MEQENSKIDEITISLKRSGIGFEYEPVRDSKNAAEMVRRIMTTEELEAREKMIALYFDRQNKLIGYFIVGIGGVAGVIVDLKLVLGVAVKTLSSGIILSHNHPSGNLKPSQKDQDITKKLRVAAAYHDIVLLDHLIVTKDNHYSFADQGLMGLSGNYPIIEDYDQNLAVELIKDESLEGTENTQIENLQNELRNYIEENQEI